MGLNFFFSLCLHCLLVSVVSTRLLVPSLSNELKSSSMSLSFIIPFVLNDICLIKKVSWDMVMGQVVAIEEILVACARTKSGFCPIKKLQNGIILRLATVYIFFSKNMQKKKKYVWEAKMAVFSPRL